MARRRDWVKSQEPMGSFAEVAPWSSMTISGLPASLLRYFKPIEVGPFSPQRPFKSLPPYEGVSKYLDAFESPEDTPPKTLSIKQKKARDVEESSKRNETLITKQADSWNPFDDPNCTLDPFCTLFVARLSFDTTEEKLKKEFSAFGPVASARVVKNTESGKPRGYAFVQFEAERDMRAAFKHADGKKIDGKRVIVDVERGRTTKFWVPRRLSGGLGYTRKGGKEINQSLSSGRQIDSRKAPGAGTTKSLVPLRVGGGGSSSSSGFRGGSLRGDDRRGGGGAFPRRDGPPPMRRGGSAGLGYGDRRDEPFRRGGDDRGAGRRYDNRYGRRSPPPRRFDDRDKDRDRDCDYRRHDGPPRGRDRDLPPPRRYEDEGRDRRDRPPGPRGGRWEHDRSVDSRRDRRDGGRRDGDPRDGDDMSRQRRDRDEGDNSATKRVRNE